MTKGKRFLAIILLSLALIPRLEAGVKEDLLGDSRWKWVEQVQNSYFGDSAKTFGELLSGHPQIKKIDWGGFDTDTTLGKMAAGLNGNLCANLLIEVKEPTIYEYDLKIFFQVEEGRRPRLVSVQGLENSYGLPTSLKHVSSFIESLKNPRSNLIEDFKAAANNQTAEPSLAMVMAGGLPVASEPSYLIGLSKEEMVQQAANEKSKVQTIQVIPSDVLSPQSIRILEDKLLGKNIMQLNLNKIEGLIELGPGAQSVHVTREMPSTIRIEIQKRRPIANVQLRLGGPYAIVADDGFIIDSRPAPDPAWILVEDFSESFKEPLIGVRLQNEGFAEAVRFMEAFKRHELARQEVVTRISLDAFGNVTVRLGEGPDFRMGSQATERLSFLAKAVSIFEAEPRKNIEYMDLQNDRVGVKRKT